MGTCDEKCQYRDTEKCHKAHFDKDGHRCVEIVCDGLLDELKFFEYATPSGEKVKTPLYTHTEERFLRPESHIKTKIEIPNEIIQIAKEKLSKKRFELFMGIYVNGQRKVDLAKAMGVSKPAVTKLEKKTSDQLLKLLGIRTHKHHPPEICKECGDIYTDGSCKDGLCEDCHNEIVHGKITASESYRVVNFSHRVKRPIPQD